METCPECGSEHDSEQGLKIHYGRSHEGSISGTKVECHNCGDSFRIHTYRAENKDERHFCSEECRSETYSNQVELSCDWCGDEFTRVQSHAKQAEKHYCSTECKGKSYRDRIETPCANCGDTVERSRAFIKRTNNTYCGDECREEHMRGAAHPRYKGSAGINRAIRRMVGEESWKVVTSELRDNNPNAECYMCGDESSANGRALHLHHIVPIMAGGTHAEELLMWLCHSCHMDVEEYTRSILEYPLNDLIREFSNDEYEPQNTQTTVQVFK